MSYLDYSSNHKTVKKQNTLPIRRWLERFFPDLFDLSGYDKEESHKARVLLYSGLIVFLASLIILSVQIIQTSLPDVPTAPLIDIISDLLGIIAGLSTVYLIKQRKIKGASYLVLGFVFITSISLFLLGPQPQSNVGGIFSLLLFSTLAMVLLEPSQSWSAFALISLTLLAVNYFRVGEQIVEPTMRDPRGQVFFSLISWLVGGGIVSLIIFTTNNVLKNQARRLRDQIQRLRQQDQQLRASEKRYRAIFEGVQDAVLVETDGGEILDVNQKACQLFGFDYETFLEQTVSDIVTEGGVILSTEMLRDNGGYIENLESTNIRANGERFPVELSARLADIAGQEVMVFVLHDITERKERERAINRQLKELNALHRISEIGIKENSEGKIIEVALSEIEEILQPDFNAVLLLDPEKRHLNLHPACKNVPSSFQGASISVDEGIIGEVVRTGSAQYYPDVRQVPHYLEIIPETQSELCVPIKSQEKTLGVINIESEKLDAYKQSDQRLLQTLAGQLGTAIERARLFNTVQQQLSRLQSLRTIDRAISSSLDIHVSLDVILNQITSQLDVDAACVLSIDRPTQSLQLMGEKGLHARSIQDVNQGIGSGLAGQVVRNNTPVHIPNLKEREDPGGFPLAEEEGFTFYYGTPLMVKGKTQGVIELYHRSPKQISSAWERFVDALAGQAAIALDNALMFDRLQRTNLELMQAYDSTLEGWAKALELRDHDTEGHSRRVTSLTLQLADELDVPESEFAHIRRGALLHDIGKMAIPDEILQKGGALNDEEWEIIKKHPQYAKEMLESIHFLKDALDIPLYHHERWDGKGYPEGLEGTQIPIAARIFAVVDVWDALTSSRPYRESWTRGKALTHIREQSGKHFDPEVVEAFLTLVERGVTRKIDQRGTVK